MVAKRVIRWAHLIFAVAVVVTMLSWAIYAILWTIPNDQSGIVDAALQSEGSFADMLPFNVTAGSEARFTVFFKTTIPAGMGTGSYRTGEDYTVGPMPWTAPRATFTQFEVHYALYTLEYTVHPLNGGGIGPTIWYSGPQGNVTAVDLQSHQVGEYSKVAVEAPSPGNYTLHFLTSQSAYAAFGRMTMGASSVTFSRPYYSDGWITIGLTGAFSITTLYVSRKNYSKAESSTNRSQSY